MKLALSLFWRILLLQVIFNLLVIVPFRHTPFIRGEVHAQWKATVLWWAFGLSLLCFHVVTRNGLVHVLWGRRLQQSDEFWKRFDLALVAFYLVLGLIVAGAWFLVPSETWLELRLAAPLALLLLFLLIVPRTIALRPPAAVPAAQER